MNFGYELMKFYLDLKLEFYNKIGMLKAYPQSIVMIQIIHLVGFDKTIMLAK